MEVLWPCIAWIFLTTFIRTRAENITLDCAKVSKTVPRSEICLSDDFKSCNPEITLQFCDGPHFTGCYLKNDEIASCDRCLCRTAATFHCIQNLTLFNDKTAHCEFGLDESVDAHLILHRIERGDAFKSKVIRTGTWKCFDAERKPRACAGGDENPFLYAHPLRNVSADAAECEIGGGLDFAWCERERACLRSFYACADDDATAWEPWAVAGAVVFVFAVGAAVVYLIRRTNMTVAMLNRNVREMKRTEIATLSKAAESHEYEEVERKHRDANYSYYYN